MWFFKKRPTAEEVIDAIIPLFSKEALDVFKVDCGDGDVYDLRRQMLLKYKHHKPNHSVEDSKKEVERSIQLWGNDLGKIPRAQNAFWLFFDKILFEK